MWRGTLTENPCVHFPDPLLGNIRLNLLNAPFVDDLTAQYAPGVSQAIARRSQLALGILDFFAENYPYRVYLFAGDIDLQDQTAFHVNLDLLSIHWVSTLQLLSGDKGYMKRDTTGSVPDILKWCIMKLWSQRLDCCPKGGCLSKQTLIIGQFAPDSGNARLPAKPVMRARR